MPKQKKTQSRPQTLYRVKNWSEYDKALVQRGSITFWLSDNYEKTWLYAGEKQRGSQFEYSDQAILIMLTVKEVFHLTNRGVEGFMRSMFELMEIELPVPDHTTLPKRSRNLKVSLPKTSREHLNIVMDSTGLKVYGEGEWKVRQHGISKRRTWRKLHLGLNPDDGEIQAVLLTTNSVSDAQALAPLLTQIEPTISDFAADGSYDKRKVYEGLKAHSPDVNILIPPRKNARIWQHGNTHAERLKRDENLRLVRKQGRKMWKKESGYHIRSLAETSVFRLKTIFGAGLSAHLLETQTTQALIRCMALNKMTHLGMPESYVLA
jgi:hypothetical protein